MKRPCLCVQECMIRFGLLIMLVVLLAVPARSQCPYTLSTGLSGNTSMAPPPSGISFEVTALQSTRICRLKAPFTAGAHLLEIFYNPNGLILVPGSSTGYNTTGWISLGQVTASGFGAGANYAEIPLDLNVMMNPGDKFGFCIRPVNSSTPIYYSSGTPYIFSD